MSNLTTLLKRLVAVDTSTDWNWISREAGMEIQIEMRSELGRTIKKVERSINRQTQLGQSEHSVSLEPIGDTVGSTQP